MRNAADMSPSTPQRPSAKPLTSLPSSGSEPRNFELALTLFSELENDPDFVRIAERWSEFSDELKEAVLKLVT